MPDQITQKLGFDASAAITSLTNLNQKLGEFRQGLQATAGGLRKFEKNAATAVATFNTLGKAAILAAASVNQLRIASGGVVPPQVASQAAAASAAMGTLGASAVIAKAKLGGLAASATTSSAAVAKVATSATAAAAATQAASAKTVAAANRTSAALAKVGKTGEQAAKTVGISWKTIGRIILAQAVIRGLSMIVSMFNDAQEAAREFSLRVGEISTIAGGALGSIDDISAATLELSRNLGIATDEVAEGLYQTLSNQVVEAGEAIRFETTAAKLSITTHSQLKESINALSSVMNSYQLDISEAEEVSATLFKTVELGRLRMGEFGDVLGRVSPLTAALGISYKEMAASLAAITQKGVPAHTAITQLTAVTQKLLRPTTKLQELYNKWGVETGPEAIERFGGLRGVLLKMRDATAGNDKEFADLLGRVRSMVGAMNLTTNEADALTHALDEMKDPTDDLDKAFARMESTIGRRSVKAWDDLDVSLHKAGKTFLEVTTPMVETLATLARNVDLVGAAAIGVGVALLVMKTSMMASIATTGVLTAAVAGLKVALLTLGPVAIVAAAAVAAAFVGRAIADSLDTATEATKRQINSQDAMTKALEAQSKARIEATKKEVAERKKLITGFVMDEEALIKRSTKVFQTSSDAIGEVLEDQLSSIAEGRSSLIAQVEDAVRGMDDAISGSEAVVAKIQTSLNDASFEKSTRGLNKNQKAWAANDRAATDAAKAAAAYSRAGASEEGIELAREKFKLAEKTAKASVAAAKASGGSVNLFRAEKQLENLRKNARAAELKFQRDRKSLQTPANALEVKNLRLQQEKLENLQEQKAEYIKIKDAAGNLKTDAQLLTDAEAAKALDPLIAAAQEAFNTTELFGELGLEDYASKLRNVTENSIASANIQFPGAAEKLKAELESISPLIKINLSVDSDEFRALREAQFGPATDFGSKTADQNRKVAEGVISDSRKFTDVAVAEQVKLTDGLNNADRRLDYKIFNNWVDRHRLANTELVKLREEREGITTEQASDTIPAQAFRKEALALSNILKEAKADTRVLTQAERDRFAALSESGRQLELNGDLSNNQLNNSVAIAKSLYDAAEAQEAYARAAKSIPKPKLVAESARVLKAFESGATAAAESEKTLKKEVDGVNDGVKATADESKKLPAAVDAGTASFAAQAAQVNKVKAEVQGLTDYQRLNQQRLELQGAPAAQPAPTVEPTIDAGSIKAGAEALKPMIEGAKDVKQSLESTGNNFGIKIINGVTQAMPAIQTLDGEVVTLAGTVGTVTANVGAVNTAVSTTANTVRLANDNTSAWTTGMGALATAAQGVVLAMQAAEQAAKRAAQAAALASQAAGGGAAGTAFSGGPAVNYRAAGGLASRGKDTIPVMASPGERITSARNSRRFASELQAINAGKEPIFRDKGGSVTNVGDVNVSVTSGETASQTARQIATSLRRELRRGTSRL